MRRSTLGLLGLAIAVLVTTVFLVRPHLEKRRAWSELVAVEGQELWKADDAKQGQATRAFQAWAGTPSSVKVILIKTLRRNRPDERVMVLLRSGERLGAHLYLSTGLPLGDVELSAEPGATLESVQEVQRAELPGTGIEVQWSTMTQIYALQNGTLKLVRRQDGQGKLVPGGRLASAQAPEERERDLLSERDDDVLAALVWLSGDGRNTDFVGRSAVVPRLNSLAKSPNRWIADAAKQILAK